MAKSKMFVYVKPAAPLAGGDVAAAAKPMEAATPRATETVGEAKRPRAPERDASANAPRREADKPAPQAPKTPSVPSTEPAREAQPPTSGMPTNREESRAAPRPAGGVQETLAPVDAAIMQPPVQTDAKTPLSGPMVGGASATEGTGASEPMPSSVLDPLRVLEAALFMSGQAMPAQELGRLVGIGAVGHVSGLLAQLSAQYEKNGSSLEVVEENPGKWVMRIRASFAPSVRRFAGEAEIPRHALRTLAYVSRHENITKRELFNRLGGSIYEDVGELVEKGFLSTKPMGRTVSLSTTPKFKQYFQG